MTEIIDVALLEGTLLKKETYLLEKTLAWGSTAILYYAKQQKDIQKKVVIKEFYPNLYVIRDMDRKKVILRSSKYQKQYKKFYQAYQNECEITAYASQFIGCIPYGEDFIENNTHYLVLDYIQADTYVNYIWNDTIQKRECLIKILEIVQNLHRQGILHLDIKPANILIEKKGNPMILDFGNSAWKDSKDSFVCCVSLQYSAPELKKGKAGTQKSDIYSLGKLIKNSFSFEEKGIILSLYQNLALIKIPIFRLPRLSGIIKALYRIQKRQKKKRKGVKKKWM